MDRSKILKYIRGNASQTEVQEVEFWVNLKADNLLEFNRIKAQAMVSSFDENGDNKASLLVLKKVKSKIKKKQRLVLLETLKYAAMLIFVLTTSYFLYHQVFSSQSEEFIPTDDAIVLTLENGEQKIIKEEKTIELLNADGLSVGTQKKNQLHYHKNSNTEELVYNTLSVPYGKKFDVVLSDNTHVFLNSGSTLKYPVNFIQNKNREVFLEGEAFFDVAKDKKHPFVVNANKINIRVLGTQFNVSSYPEDLQTKTVLVEGSVGLYQGKYFDKNTASLLKPGQLGSFDRTTETLLTENVDTAIYTSWREGNVLFKHEPFKNILKKLERQYDVVIVNQNKEIAEVSFTASFHNESLDYILETFHENFGVNYTYQNDIITITP
ncbi:MAG: DUF4974 domain-containing protein [Flavicella sp.]|nr:DUF4974 domain-containing protein [Flavicella sp.]